MLIHRVAWECNAREYAGSNLGMIDQFHGISTILESN